MVAAINSFLTSLFVRYTSDDDGQTMAEYGIILALVAVIAIAAFQLLGTQINTAIGGITSVLGS